MSYASGLGSGLLWPRVPPAPALRVSRACPALPGASHRVDAEIVPGKQVIVNAASLARFLVRAYPDLIPSIFRRSTPADVLWPAVVSRVPVQVAALLPRRARSRERLQYERVDPSGHLLAVLAQPDEQVALLVAPRLQYSSRAVASTHAVQPGDASHVSPRGDLIKPVEANDAAPTLGVCGHGIHIHVHMSACEHVNV